MACEWDARRRIGRVRVHALTYTLFGVTLPFHRQWDDSQRV